MRRSGSSEVGSGTAPASQTVALVADDDQPAVITAEVENENLPNERLLSNNYASSTDRYSSSQQSAAKKLTPHKRSAEAGEPSGRGDGSMLQEVEGLNDLSWRRNRMITTILVNLSAIMERTDEQLLPAVYAFVASSFDATPKQLGFLTQSRALVQALASPFGGYAGYCFNRVWVITAGCTIWGCMTAVFSSCTSLSEGYLLWAINGIGLALVIPTGQSLTADYYSEASRGRAFGALYLTGAIGAMLGQIYATNLGHLTILGVEGWRFAFFSVAMISLLIGVLNFLFGSDPRCRKHWQLHQDTTVRLSTGNLVKELKEMCLMPTFLIIILQGIVGSTPWNALVFLTLYMQTIGMSDTAASILVSLFLAGSAVGGLLGGWLGDVAAAKFPRTGRIAVCQFSVLIGVPLSVLLFKGLPLDGHLGTIFAYAILLKVMGVLISWAAPACNNPIFAEIVPPHLRTMIYAFDRSFESAIAASAAPLVGLLAENVFGWQGSATPHGTTQPDVDLSNAKALGNALLVCTIVPWTLCGIFYTGLYYTYPGDREKAAEAARELHEESPEDAGHRDPEASTKSGSHHTDGTVSDSERQRLLRTSTVQTDSSLELAPLGEEGPSLHSALQVENREADDTSGAEDDEIVEADNVVLIGEHISSEKDLEAQ